MITGGSGSDILTGGAGNDTFNYTVALVDALAANVDTITDFEIGTNQIDFTDLVNTNLRGTGANYEVVAAGANAVAANTGIIEQNGDLGDLLVATVVTAANTMTGWANNDSAYFVGTDGADTGLYLVSDSDNNGSIDTAVLVVTLTGVDETNFSATNFADFM